MEHIGRNRCLRTFNKKIIRIGREDQKIQGTRIQFRQAALLNELMYLIYRNIPYSTMEDNVLRNTDKALKRINLLLKYIHENYYLRKRHHHW